MPLFSNLKKQLHVPGWEAKDTVMLVLVVGWWLVWGFTEIREYYLYERRQMETEERREAFLQEFRELHGVEHDGG